MKATRHLFCWLLALFFILAGLNHLRSPGTYLPLMPAYLPWHLGLIYGSGIAEVLGGLGVFMPRLRRLSGWGLLALLAAVFPANLHAALHGYRNVAPWILWWRLPLQLVIGAWVYWTCLAEGRRDSRKADPDFLT
jgi:uncharacterized membrane protein